MIKHTSPAMVAFVPNKYINSLASYPRNKPVVEVILHDTVTNSVKTTVQVLTQRGLAYHYLIDKDGEVYELQAPERMTYHAKGYNTDTIGCAFVCGGAFGPPNDSQRESCVELLAYLKNRIPSIQFLSAHKFRSTSGKIDPEGVTDDDFKDMASKSGLIFKKVR